ncbi:SKAP2 protein, partial [Polypterus senegalus]
MGIGVGCSPVGSHRHGQGVLQLGLLSLYGQHIRYTQKCSRNSVINHLEHFWVDYKRAQLPPLRSQSREEEDEVAWEEWWRKKKKNASIENVNLSYAIVVTGHQYPPVAATDLLSVLKAGYLEKRRKDKQQKGEFAIDGYTVRMNNMLRKDAKKDCCFEITAPDKRIYQFTAASQKDAEDWVDQIQFVLKDMQSGMIPVDEDGETYDDIGVDDDKGSTAPIDDDIYEVLPDFCHSEDDKGQAETHGNVSIDVSEKVNLTQALTIDPLLCLL